jgi:probable HAF family extracellular repeat protein
MSAAGSGDEEIEMLTSGWSRAMWLWLVLPVAGMASAAEWERDAAGSDGLPSVYVADFVATAAQGFAMNDAGDVVGWSYGDPGCGPFCLPPQDTVVWRGGKRIVLPAVPGYAGNHPRSINSQGWVAGLAGYPGAASHAVVWKPNGDVYQAIDLGVLPGTTISHAVGIDDLGRVVGWSTTGSIPPTASPFLWTESGGMVDLSAQGFPDEQPLAISPGGTVATPSAWYRLDDPGSVSFLPPAPPGFAVGTYATAINDAGDQARFLVSISTENPVYPFRFHHDDGTWQILSTAGTGHLSTYGIGSINAAKDVTATVQNVAVIAAGPDGLAVPLQSLLSPAYGGASIGSGGPMNGSGQVLTGVMIGNSPRLMKLTPASPCVSDCTRVSQVLMQGKVIQDPAEPGSCSQDGAAYNIARTRVAVTDETGAPLAGVLVHARFLDDYWTDKPVSGTTNAAGLVNFSNKGPCGIGAVAFLVDKASVRPRVFDRTTGILTKFVIPQ